MLGDWPHIQQNIIKLADLFTDQAGNKYMVTCMPEGTTLEEYVSNLDEAFIPIKSVITLTKAIASVILELHSRMIVHRDISLANVHIKTGKPHRANQPKTIESLKLGGFDLAFCFEKDN